MEFVNVLSAGNVLTFPPASGGEKLLVFFFIFFQKTLQGMANFIGNFNLVQSIPIDGLHFYQLRSE